MEELCHYSGNREEGSANENTFKNDDRWLVAAPDSRTCLKSRHIALISLEAYPNFRLNVSGLIPASLRMGSLLLFDEFIGEKESGKRALEEWMAESGMRTVKIADLVRELSGWGSMNNSRTIHQIMDENEL